MKPKKPSKPALPQVKKPKTPSVARNTAPQKQASGGGNCIYQSMTSDRKPGD